MWDDDVMPVEIRPGITVLIKGIPWDLTKAEAEKLANVVTALASPAPSREDSPHGTSG